MKASVRFCLIKVSQALFTLAALFLSGFAWAGCSSYIGQATLNEFSLKGPDFIEVKLISGSIPVSTYQTWSVRICNDGGPTCETISLADADDSTSPWLVIYNSEFNSARIDFKDGFDAVLLDGSGDVIDYLSANNYLDQFQSCSYVYDTTLSSNNGTKFAERSPDGFGGWRRITANSTPDSPGAGNGGSETLPVAEWQMEEDSWDGSSGEVVDNTGNSHDGTASGATTADTSPDPARNTNPGTCRYGEFDGVDDFVDMGASGDFNFTDAMTISAWIHPRSAGGNNLGAVLSKGGVFLNFVPYYSYALQLSAIGGGGQTIDFLWCSSYFFGFCSAPNFIRSTVPLTYNSWTHVALAFTDTEQSLYINGQLNTTTNFSAAISTNTSPLYLGGMEQAISSAYSFDGPIDEVRLYDSSLDASQIQAIYQDTHPCATVNVDHYAISYDGGSSFSDSTGITCEASPVTIIAHDSSDNPTAPGSGTTINLSTSTGEGYWSNPDVGSIVDNGNGDATYTFDTNDTVTLQFNHTSVAIDPNPVNIDVDGGNEGGGEDPDIQFFDSGFRFIDSSDNLIGTPDNYFHQVSAEESGSFFLQAIRTDNDTGSCTGVFSDGADVDLRLGAECSNPSTCAGLQVSVSNNAAAEPLTTSDDNAGAGAAAYTDVTLRFGADSKAELTMNYPDAGAVSLHAEYEILNDDGSDSGVVMLGSSSGVVFKPDDLVITLVETNPPAVTNPATTNSGNGFLPSGTAFRVVVEALNAADTITPNFGNENNPPGSEGIIINLDSLVYPAGGNMGSLSAASSFTVTATPGQFENTAIAWNEVGSFTAYASIADGDYLGAGDVTGTTSGTVGRFYPSLIVLNSSSTDNSCSSGGFSYLSEPGIDVIYELEARNLAGGVVVNYDNVDLTYDTGSVNYAVEDNDDGTDLSARLTSLDAISWGDGVASFNDSTVSFARDMDAISGDTLIDGPFTQLQIGINIDDQDGANIGNLDMQPDEADDPTNCVVATNCSFRQIGTTLNAVFGRLLTRDSHGPETAPLSVPFQTEFWQNNQFFLNTDDSCTSLPRTDIAFDGQSIDVDNNLEVDVGASTTTGSFANLTADDVVMVNGDAQLVFSAPNDEGSFPLDVDLNSVSAIPWLRFDWNQNGDHDDDGQLPTATVSFGSYRGHDRIIYWQEQFR